MSETQAVYYVTKHSWRGKYKRLFAITKKGLKTFNPSAPHEDTNAWGWEELNTVSLDSKSRSQSEFLIHIKKKGKVETMKFSTEHRDELLTEAMQLYEKMAGLANVARFNGVKHKWDESVDHCTIIVGPASLYVVLKTGQVKHRFDYRLIQGFTEVTDVNGGFVVVYEEHKRLYLLGSNQRNEIIQACQEAAAAHLCIGLKRIKPGISSIDFHSRRMGDFSTDEALTSYVEFNVTKTRADGRPSTRRALCLTENCLIERDPATYSIASLRSLQRIAGIARSRSNPQQFIIEFDNRRQNCYLSPERDSLLATLLDSVRGSGNRDVCVKSSPGDPHMRWAPLYAGPDEDIETLLLKFLGNGGNDVDDAILRFNANVSASGLAFAVSQERLFAQNKEKLIEMAISALLSAKVKDPEAKFFALRRLVSSKAGFSAFTTLVRFRDSLGAGVVEALKAGDDAVLCAAVDTLAALMCPMHDNADLRQEQLNKISLLSSQKFLELLLGKLKENCDKNSGALIISALLDLFTFVICPPFSETTAGENFDWMLTSIAGLGRSFFKLFQHPSLAIQKSAGLLMQAMIEEGSPEVVKSLQTLAIDEGAFLIHTHSALFSVGTRAAANRGLSRRLIALWATNFEPTQKLLRQILPAGLLRCLESTESVVLTDEGEMIDRDNLKVASKMSEISAVETQLLEVERAVKKQTKALLAHWRGIQNRSKPQEEVQVSQPKPIVLRRRRENTKIKENWTLLFYQCYKDHQKPDLIWNYKTREELRVTLENEIRTFTDAVALIGNEDAAWNYAEFEVMFNSLAGEVKVGDYYLRVLLDMDGKQSGLTIHQSPAFFSQLYHRFLLTTSSSMKVQCLHAMAIVYERCYEEIGLFEDAGYIVKLLETTKNKAERDRFVMFIEKLMLYRDNVKLVINAGGVKLLIDLVTLAHLQKNRPKTTVLQRNAIIAGEELEAELEEKEWYYGSAKGSTAEKDRTGPISSREMKQLYEEGDITERTKVWAQGMDGWRCFVEVPQLKWTLLGEGESILSESELSATILNIFTKMCEQYPARGANGQLIRPPPRVKQLLCQSDALPHLVQLLLTFDVTLVEKVARLLPLILVDSPLMPRLYLTGVFYFIIMYTGNNVLPIAVFLKMTHLLQSFKSEEIMSNSLKSRSILGQILPEAMVYFLENHSVEKFSEIFLGEFDTPEAIWNSEMRRQAIEKIAAHVADFSPRLRANTRAIYQYIPLPQIIYPSLEKELFCGYYYLRHLTNTQQFPKWPIRDPVRLLKDTLNNWRAELNKEPGGLSEDDALKTLGLDPAAGPFSEPKVRKAYFKMAQKYHPDKNPEGKEMFQAVNQAYEQLAAKSDEVDGPNPVNIRLLIKAQAILFENYRSELEPYKYAGYPMLVETVKSETDDEQLYSKGDAELLSPSVELAYYTVCCSALNAEELNREKGLFELRRSLNRCMSTLSKSSEAGDLDAKVCLFVCRTLTMSAQFPSCVASLTDEPESLLEDIIRLLCSHLVPLQLAAVEAVASFGMIPELRKSMVNQGVLPILMEYLFEYDYTLEEAGIEKDMESNKQEQKNKLAKQALHAIIVLAGLLPSLETDADIRRCLDCCMTSYLVSLMESGDLALMLKLFTTNSETPLLIWEGMARNELADFLEKERETALKDASEVDLSRMANFKISAHSEELIVHGVFVRVFNEQPQFQLPDAEGYLKSLLDYLGNQAQYFASIGVDGTVDPIRLKQTSMALNSVFHVLSANQAYSMQCVNSLRLLSSFFVNQHTTSEIQLNTLRIFGIVAAVQEVVLAIAQQRLLSSILLVVERLTAREHQFFLQVLSALSSHPEIVKQFIPTGGVLYTTNLFANSTEPTVRKEAASLLAKAISDRLSGPRVRISLSKLLPPIFADAMADNAEASVTLYEGIHENPELIWSEETRQETSLYLERSARDLSQQQAKNPEIDWKPPSESFLPNKEFILGGVYIRLLLQNPGWQLRRPKEFITTLFDRITDLTEPTNGQVDQNELDQLSEAGCGLFSTQINLSKLVPGMGILPTLIKRLSETQYLRPILLLLNALCMESSCVAQIGEIQCSLRALKRCLIDDQMAMIAFETIFRATNHSNSNLTAQAMSNDGEFVKALLEELSLNRVNKSAKAQIVKILKAFVECPEYGPQVAELLEESEVWKSYSSQRHDLFIEDRPVLAIQSGTTHAGYLTQGSTGVANAPPPS